VRDEKRQLNVLWIISNLQIISETSLYFCLVQYTSVTKVADINCLCMSWC